MSYADGQADHPYLTLGRNRKRRWMTTLPCYAGFDAEFTTDTCKQCQEQGLDLRYLRQGYLEEDYILDLGRVETTLLDLSYWMLFC